MRLLQLDNYPSFSLEEFTGADEVPPYAILSHTWGKDADEVKYQDIIRGTGNDKAGYDKLHFCAVQAKNDQLRYCWIDTCCINQDSSADLTEGINSMFRWYQNAAKCYVFLADVSTPTTEDDRDSLLRNSRWFTRGWTLQELLAPRSVQFFSQKGELLGDKTLLEKQIHQITGISTHALRGEQLSHFPIDERMSWMAHRSTKRPEDMVYSLLGIFDIHMEAIYGEGEHHAYLRLLEKVERYSKNHQLSKLLRDQLQLSSTKQPEAPVEAPTWIVPFERNSCFTGREHELARIEEMLFDKYSTTKLAITGLGGVGKTQLVIELVYRIADKQKRCSAIWISAVSVESLHQSYLDVARRLGIPGFQEDKADVKRLVQAHLSKENMGQWLLVVDNADDVDMWFPKAGAGRQPGQGLPPLIDYLPKSSQGAVVFTTRNTEMAVDLAKQNVVDIPAMGEDTAAKLLENYLVNPDLVKSEQEARTYLLRQLTYLPLAIVQAAMYINKKKISLADYVSLLNEQEEDVIDLLSKEFEDYGRYRDIKNPVATTWLISFDQIRRSDQLAAEYLSFMACIEPKDIPESLLPHGPSRIKEVDAIGTLTAYSFVNRRQADNCLDLHRLVHLATRNWLRKEDLLAKSTEQAILQLEEVFPNSDHQNRTEWRKYLAHASHVLKSNITRGDEDAKTRLLWKLGMCLYQEGQWNEAEWAFLGVMETRKRVLGPEHPDTLTSMNNLASTYWEKGQWDKAEELEVQVLETRKRVLGPEHPSTLTSMNNLASTYRHKGQWDKAEELQVQVVETRKRVLGPEHPDTLSSMNNLALTYRHKGQWDKAEDLEVQVVETHKRVLGPEHPDTLTSMNNLALTYSKKGQWDKAEELQVQVVETCKRVLGPEHPSTLTSMNNLALTYREKGQWDKAEELQVQVVETRKRVLGPEHPSTLTSMNNLALTYSEKGQWDKAEELQVQVVETCKRVLGPEHPSTLTSMGNLASTYWEKGQWDKAEELQVQVVETRKRVLGPEHPSTLTSMGNLASTYWEKGQWDKAEELQVQVVETCKRVLGPEHPSTLTSMNNLALTYSEKGQWDKAEELQVYVVETRKRVLGPEHLDTLTSMGNLASTYWEKGQWDKAEELQVQVVETRKRVFGPEHPSTLTSMNNLALTYSEKGQWDKAEELQVQVVETRKRVLGPEHPSTLTSMGNLASTYWEKGQWDKAEELQVQVVETHKRVFGPGHPHTVRSKNNLSRIWEAMGKQVSVVKSVEECVQLRRPVWALIILIFLPISLALSVWQIRR